MFPPPPRSAVSLFLISVMEVHRDKGKKTTEIRILSLFLTNCVRRNDSLKDFIFSFANWILLLASQGWCESFVKECVLNLNKISSSSLYSNTFNVCIYIHHKILLLECFVHLLEVKDYVLFILYLMFDSMSRGNQLLCSNLWESERPESACPVNS